MSSELVHGTPNFLIAFFGYNFECQDGARVLSNREGTEWMAVSLSGKSSFEVRTFFVVFLWSGPALEFDSVSHGNSAGWP